MPETTETLQDIGHEFGCPPGISITKWLRLMLRQRVAADAVCLAYEAGGYGDPGRAMDEVRDALGRRA